MGVYNRKLTYPLILPLAHKKTSITPFSCRLHLDIISRRRVRPSPSFGIKIALVDEQPCKLARGIVVDNISRFRA